ncbi:hypothetical protein KIN20_031768 [Parelaphostrongylus tenuis]|uniref:Potassium channel domain-containing protein n=1 Tax=Parelaphostrongylus tenuis TaxID=148309 RepID=A0AAD5R5Y2_PARTN|nr:hypothetical protein KIN20_031768 [Parelaphostrongylus tenuis]
MLKVPCVSTSSSAQSIPEFSRVSSVASPGEGYGLTVAMDRGSVLQRAAWFLSTHEKSAEPQEPERPRGLASVSRTIQRTGSQLRKTRLFHLFYILVLPIYTVIGAWIFKTLDGEHDDRLIEEFNNRCDLSRNASLNSIMAMCQAGDDCFNLMRIYLEKVERCYKNVYTTIGYGNMAADTTQCRLATIIYGAFGIPLFFAFVKEEGNLFRNVFINIYNRLSKWRRRHCGCHCGAKKSETENKTTPTCQIEKNDTLNRPLLDEETQSKKARFVRKCSTASMLGQKSLLDEQRRVFIAGVLFFILYILLSSFLFSISTEFDYFTSVYFLFNSVALIGFGDVFPRDPRTILFNAVFIIFGVVLFSMCYFILQEEIRNKAFEASRKARISISKYSHTILQHASRGAWSRRNSPLLDANSESAFDRLRKRRQSAPVLTLTVPSEMSREV